MSIFTKLCPNCAGSIPSSLKRCECGYIFDTTTDGSISTGDLIHQEERLYYDYLTARATQAEQEYLRAQSAVSFDPENNLRAAELLRAEQELNAARAELTQQSRRVETTKSIAKKTRKTPTATPKAAPKIERAAPAPVKPRSSPPPAAPRAAPKVNTPAPNHVNATEVFRAVQAAKAEEALRAQQEAIKAQLKKVEAAKPKLAPPPPPPPKPTPAPKPVVTIPKPAVRIKPVVAKPVVEPKAKAKAKTKECPNCTASLKLDAMRCRCGFEFSGEGAEIPSLDLNSSDLAMIQQSLGR